MWKTAQSAVFHSWWLWKVEILKWKICLLSRAALWNTHPNPNNTVNSKHCSQKDPKHVFFRSRLLFFCHTSMQHGHPRSISLMHTNAHTHTRTHTHTHTNTHAIAQSFSSTSIYTHTNTSHPHTTQKSPPAPTHLMFFPYYAKVDTHNCAGVVCCFCWRLSTAPMMSRTEVIIVAGTANLHHSAHKYAVSVRSNCQDGVFWF